jgi:hypothetical protein
MSDISAVDQSGGLTPYSSGGRVDPYNIYQLNFAARGGEKHVKYDSTFYFKGELKIGENTFGLEEFIKKPLKSLSRISSNFKLIFSNGDDGKFLWSSQDGNVTSFFDGDSPERELRRLWDEYAYTDPKNRHFTSKFTRKISVDGSTCYEIKIRNRKTDEVVTHYYDTETFLLKRELRESAGNRTQTDFSDYRAVGNIKMPFKKEITNLNTLGKQIITWDKIEKGSYMSESLFLVPEDKSKNADFSALGIGTNINLLA